MDALIFGLLIMAACYVCPLVMPDGRWLAGIALAGALGGGLLWATWVERQSSTIGGGVAALFVLSAAAALALGVAVRAVTLWRGWTGGRAVAAGVSGALVGVAAIAWVLWAG